jgi:MFS superfamily sulfate permease-like transporter
VRPEQGLFTAVVAGFLISALGGSRVQVGGPTGAFIVLVYGIVQTHGYDGLAVATMMAGGLMVLMGFARLGNVAIDATGLRALEDDLDKAKADGTQVLMTGVQAQPRTVLMRAGVLDRVGEENVVPDFQSAVERAKTILGTPAP